MSVSVAFDICVGNGKVLPNTKKNKTKENKTHTQKKQKQNKNKQQKPPPPKKKHKKTQKKTQKTGIWAKLFFDCSGIYLINMNIKQLMQLYNIRRARVIQWVR